MSIVIVGGHDRMVCQYKKICKEHKCKVKVFTHMRADMSNQIGSPDVVILFTNTVSHKMVRCAVTEAEKTILYMVQAIWIYPEKWRKAVTVIRMMKAEKRMKAEAKQYTKKLINQQRRSGLP